VTIVPVDSSNSLAIRGDSAIVARLSALAAELDAKAAFGTDIRVIFLEHADAAQLLPVLQQLLGQPVTAPPAATGLSGSNSSSGISSTTMSTRQVGGRSSPQPATNAASPSATAPTGTGIFGSRNAVVTRFEGANALVIAAPTDIQRQLGEVIRQLDTRREQVLVEAIIVEISDNAAKQLGVQLLLAGLDGSNIPFAVTNYSNASPNILTLAAAAASERLRTTTTTVNGQVVTTDQSSPLAEHPPGGGGRCDPRSDHRPRRLRDQIRQRDFRGDHQRGEVRQQVERPLDPLDHDSRQTAGADPGRPGDSGDDRRGPVAEFRQISSGPSSARMSGSRSRSNRRSMSAGRSS
jgi:hypothetical protein